MDIRFRELFARIVRIPRNVTFCSNVFLLLTYEKKIIIILCFAALITLLFVLHVLCFIDVTLSQFLSGKCRLFCFIKQNLFHFYTYYLFLFSNFEQTFKKDLFPERKVSAINIKYDPTFTYL